MIITITIERTSYRAGCFPKQCGCGLSHDEEQWQALRLVGISEGTDKTCGKYYGPDIELRDCPCGSTIGVVLEG
jgi:hypothetical protein